MKLTDLEPRWSLDADIWVHGELEHDANRKGMGLTFLCPHCRKQRLGVFFANPVDGKPPTDDAALLWTRSAGDDFSNLSITPSIDCSASGHWHGFITNGAVT